MKNTLMKKNGIRLKSKVTYSELTLSTASKFFFFFGGGVPLRPSDSGAFARASYELLRLLPGVTVRFDRLNIVKKQRVCEGG